MTVHDFTPVLHLLGFAAAIAIYGMLVAMVWRAGVLEMTRLPLAAGVLGLIWNMGSLAMFGLPELGFRDPPQVVDALAYTALAFLPAVVVQSILKGQSHSLAHWVTRVAYFTSALAGVGHFVNVVREGYAPLPLAQHSLSWAYGGLVLVMVFLTRAQPSFRRALWMIALAIFAVTGSELAYHSGGSILLDMVGHHASMLLAFVILYQEYRFALADRFLKRALTLIALVGVAMGSYVLVLSRIGSTPATPTDPRFVGLVLALWIGTALVYPQLRSAIHRQVDHWVLRRDIHGRLRTELAAAVESAETSSQVMHCLTQRLATEFGASDVDHGPMSEMDLDDAGPSSAQQSSDSVWLLPRGAGATLVLPTAETPRYACRLHRLSEGRSLTSEDVALLEWVAIRAARRIDQLRLVHERYEHELKKQEIQKLATEAELRALRAQINPHFLFNALTTIGHLIQEAPDRAMDTLMNLTELLRRVLRSNEELTTLGEELDLVVAYLDIERARFEERLQTTIEISPLLRSVRLPPLILQPLVENAVKHGVAPLLAGGSITIRAEIDESAALLRIVVIDSGAGGTPDAVTRGRARGVGLRNVEQRLRAHYGASASVSMQSRPNQGTTVQLSIPTAASEKLDVAVS